MWEVLMDAGWVRCTNVYMPQQPQTREAMTDAILGHVKLLWIFPQARKGVVPIMFFGDLIDCKQEQERRYCRRTSCQQSHSVVSQALVCSKC